MTAAIAVKGLGKRYRIVHEDRRNGYRTLRESIAERVGSFVGRLRRDGKTRGGEDFWALRDVDFDVPAGEVVGVIGRNGAGKSTLLKILSRITKPTTGSAEIRGRVGSLLEVGTGFHPELTGRENIYLNGAILGMPQREIRRRFDDIVAFAGIDDFLDTPVKRYSSGMYVRLAFAVSAHLETEILLVDEVLAVGDLAFQKQCMGKMRALSHEGRTVFLVSHNLSAIRALTTRCLLLHNGRIVGDGSTSDVIETYLQEAWEQAVTEEERDLGYFRRDRQRDTTVTIRDIGVRGGVGRPPVLDSGEPITIYFDVESRAEVLGAFVAFSLTNQQGERVATFLNHDQSVRIDIAPGRQTIVCTVSDLPLTPGRYTITGGVNRNVASTAFDLIVDYPIFQIIMPDVERGALEWSSRPWGAVHWRDVAWWTEPTLQSAQTIESR